MHKVLKGMQGLQHIKLQRVKDREFVLQRQNSINLQEESTCEAVAKLASLRSAK